MTEGDEQPSGTNALRLIRRINRMNRGASVVLLRHSVRQRDLRRGDAGDPLTPGGRRLAFDLGRKLPAGNYRLFTSPIGRCLDTARALRAGLAASRASPRLEEELPWLGPFYLEDEAKVRGRIERLGLLSFLAGWLGGRREPGLRPALECWQRIRSELSAHVARMPADTIDVCVTHDWHLLLTMTHALGARACSAVGYLEALAVWRTDERTYVEAAESAVTPQARNGIFVSSPLQIDRPSLASTTR